MELVKHGCYTFGMKWADIQELPCSTARALSVIGDRWTALIVRDAFMGVRRFDDWQASLGITRHRLSDRLDKLVEDGVLERRPYQTNPVRNEYRLTAKGRDLYPIILMLKQWGDKWMAGEAGPPALHRHTKCGHITQPTLVCSECHEPLSPFDMEALPGPGLANHPLVKPQPESGPANTKAATKVAKKRTKA